MPRATNAPASRKRRKRTLAKAKGFRGFRSTHFRYAKDAVRKAMTYNYRDRKVRKRNFRNLWIQRINAAARAVGITYSRLMEGLKFAGIEIDRKVLSEIAIKDEAAFVALANQAKAAIEKKAEQIKAAA
ncbi:MAG: 50S ribosomal protein L20 [Prosthecobacter sp.]|nr:50S ribosomal protein L20 [Prosthecobacter sp.]